MRCLIDEGRERDWDEYVDPIIMAYRNSVHSTTGQTPQFLVFGHDMTMPMDILTGSYVWDYETTEDFVRDKLSKLTTAWDFASRKMYSNQVIQKKYYDKRNTCLYTQLEEAGFGAAEELCGTPR